jgi:ATP-dependent DNA helicase PIF1
MTEDDTSFEDLVDAGENVYLTGPGGTGKSYRTRRMIEREPGRFSVTASTGIAALNIGGLTLHRWSGMMLGPQNGESDQDYLDHLMEDKRYTVRAGFDRIRGAQSLVIDEVSMLNGRTLDFLDFLSRKLRRDSRPFGGIQVIVTGDFLQLPPVKKDPRAPYDWAFESRAWREADFQVVHLTKIHRQDDADFVRALSEFRFGRVTGHNARLLRSRVAKFPDADLTRLFTHNAQVDKWNAYRLGEIDSEPRIFQAELTGPEHQQQFLIKNLLTPQRLELKVGARVMFTVNSAEGGFVNGQTGVVLGFDRTMAKDCKWVPTVLVNSDGRSFSVTPFTWPYDNRDKSSATFRQFPLRLSYALTIHKSQGLTLESAYIDVRAAREPGQAYVALSRLRELSGLHLKDWFSGVFVSKAATEFYRNAA